MRYRICCQIVVLIGVFSLTGCAVVKGTYDAVAGTVKGVYYVTTGTAKAVYHVGKFTFNVVKAPIEWSLMNDDIETIVKTDICPGQTGVIRHRVSLHLYTVEFQKLEETGRVRDSCDGVNGLAGKFGKSARLSVTDSLEHFSHE